MGGDEATEVEGEWGATEGGGGVIDDEEPRGMKRLRWWLTTKLEAIVEWLDSWDGRS